MCFKKNFKAFKNLKMLVKIKYKIINYLALKLKKNEWINSEKKSSLIITKSFSTPKN